MHGPSMDTLFTGPAQASLMLHIPCATANLCNELQIWSELAGCSEGLHGP